ASPRCRSGCRWSRRRGRGLLLPAAALAAARAQSLPRNRRPKRNERVRYGHRIARRTGPALAPRRVTTMHDDAELFHRHPGNPVLSAAYFPYPMNSVFNPAAALLNGETVLVTRVEDRRGISHLAV